MADKIAEAFVEIRAHLDRLESDFGTAKSITKRETNSLAAIGNRAMSMAGAGLAAAATAGAAAVGVAAASVTALGVKSLETFASFEKGMNEVFTLLPGISKEAMDKMSEQVLDLSKKMGVLPMEVVPALYSALSAGVPPGNVFEFLETAQQAAKAGVTDLNTAVEGIAAVVNAYGADVISAGEASDLMFATVKAGITTFPQLAASLANVTPVSSELGVSFRDVSAWLAQLTAQKVPTATATTSIRAALVELRQDTSKVAQAFQEVSGVSFREFIAKGGNVAEALQMLEKYAKQNGTSLGNLFGSVEAGGAALGVTGDKMAAFAGRLKEFGDVSGSTGLAFEQMAQGAAYQFEQFQAAVQRAFIRIGEALSPAMEPLFAMMNELLEIAEEELTPAFQAIGEAIGAIDPDASGAKSLFAAVADGMVFVVDALMAAAVALEDVAVGVEDIVWLAKNLPKLSPAYWGVRALMGNTEETRRERGLSAAEKLDKFRQQQAEKQLVKQDVERIAALTGPIDPQQKANRAKEEELMEQMTLLEEERKAIIKQQAAADLEAPKAEASAVKGFVDFVEFGRQLQDQLFDADEKRKTEEFQRKMEDFERKKAEVLEKNAAETKRVADQLEKIMVAT